MSMKINDRHKYGKDKIAWGTMYCLFIELYFSNYGIKSYRVLCSASK